jgi:hypothetical protein
MLMTLLAILSLLPAQLLFPYRERDIVVDKLRFKTIAQILGLIAMILLLVEAYLILTA